MIETVIVNHLEAHSLVKSFRLGYVEFYFKMGLLQNDNLRLDITILLLRGPISM